MSNIIVWPDFKKSLEEYQEDIYLRRINQESEFQATRDMIQKFKEEIELKKMVVERMEVKLIKDEKEYYDDI